MKRDIHYGTITTVHYQSQDSSENIEMEMIQGASRKMVKRNLDGEAGTSVKRSRWNSEKENELVNIFVLIKIFY